MSLNFTLNKKRKLSNI